VKITEAMLDAAMSQIIPGMAVDRTDMKRALEAALDALDALDSGADGILNSKVGA